MIWLRIYDQPLRQFYQLPESRAFMDARAAQHGLLSTVEDLRSGVDGEAPTITVEMRNRAGESSRLFAMPPLGARAEVLDRDAVVFAGLITSVDLGESCRVVIGA